MCDLKMTQRCKAAQANVVSESLDSLKWTMDGNVETNTNVRKENVSCLCTFSNWTEKAAKKT